MRSTRWFAVAGVASLVLAGGCSQDGTDVASGPSTPTSSAPSPASSPTTTTGASAGDSSTTAGDSARDAGGIGAQVGRLTPEASSSFISKVGERTSAEDTGSFHFTLDVDGATDHPGHVSLMVVTGAYDHKTGASRATIDMSGLAKADPASLGEDASLFTAPIDTIQIGTTAYLKIPGLTDALGGWIKTTGDENASGVKPLLDLFKVEDITHFLTSLQAAGAVRQIGSEDVGGVATIHYHADIDPSKLDTSDISTDALLGNLGTASEAAVDVWVDEDALVHRVQIVADAGALGTDLAKTFAGGEATLVLEMSDLGAPADIHAPPEDEVVDVGDAGGLGLDEAFDTGDPAAPAAPTTTELPTTTEP